MSRSLSPFAAFASLTMAVVPLAAVAVAYVQVLVGA